MSLRETLSEIVQKVEGSRAAVIMASDGIPIDEVVVNMDGLDLQLLTVEYATVLKDVKRTIELLKVGETEELCITSGQLYVVLRVLSDELFVVLVLDRDGNLGKGRYMLRLKCQDFIQELL
ncbi:MAG: roadblock/LC7 domain-containing protein [Desulfuromonadales bacterium]|nr:roadblock/LC7 domain-containing protein [Desulfuromonadales bacterium]